MPVRRKRAYERPTRSDGFRVLVDRLWPRGLRKDDSHLDAWLKDVAPSDELRRWFGHDPSRFDEFRSRYEEELRGASAREPLRDLADRAAGGTVTLVYAARDEEHNNAVVLGAKLERMAARRKRPR